jgi:hypothetical protein
MSSGNTQQVKQVQKDWEQREFVEVLSVHILAITEFLNTFDVTVRNKLGILNEKLVAIERRADFIEQRLNPGS